MLSTNTGAEHQHWRQWVLKEKHPWADKPGRTHPTAAPDLAKQPPASSARSLVPGAEPSLMKWDIGTAARSRGWRCSCPQAPLLWEAEEEEEEAEAGP